MLTKPFSVMNLEDWDRPPRNTNGIERANYSAKSGGHIYIKLSLYAAMQSLYEKDKMFALQYIAAEDGSKITYRSPVDEEHAALTSCCEKKKAEGYVCDKNASYGPPINISILKILKYSQEIRERKWIRIVMKTMKAPKRHPVINKKLKYFMLMGCGTEDGCHHLISNRKMDYNVL